MVFGGKGKFKRQVSHVNNCALERVGDLEFDFQYGACASVLDQVVYLCFSQAGRGESRVCRMTNADNLMSFEPIRKSKFSHKRIRITSSDGT